MQITRYADGSLKLYFSDEDDYEITKNNRMEVYLTNVDVEKLRRWI